MEAKLGQNVTFKPLNRGIVTAIPGQLVPKEAAVQLVNIQVDAGGLTKRGKFTPIVDELPGTLGIVYHSHLFTSSEGLSELLLIGENEIRELSKRTVLKDPFVLDEDLYFFEQFDPFVIRSTQAYDTLVLTDGNNPPIMYQGNKDEVSETGLLEALWLSPEDDYVYPTSVKDIAYFSNRLWMVNFYESSEYHPKRVRWTNVNDFQRVGVLNYLDLPESSNELIVIKPMGNLLVIYGWNDIFFGRPSNFVDLPYTFTKLETANIGLVGQRAVCSWQDGHYFVSYNNIYFFSASSALEPKGTYIVEQVLSDDSFDLKATLAIADNQREKILFCFKEANGGYSTVLVLDTKTSAWSVWKLSDVTSILTAQTYYGLTWADLDDPPFDMTTWSEFSEAVSESTTQRPVYPTYRSLSGRRGEMEVLLVKSVDSTESLLAYDETQSTSERFVYESVDFDFGLADINKTITQFKVKLRKTNITNSTLVLNVSFSRNQGESFNSVGSILIPPTFDEGFVSFRFTGSLLRFKIESTTEFPPWGLSEVSLRFVERGLETHRFRPLTLD